MDVVGKLGLVLIAFWASGMVADYLKAGLYSGEADDNVERDISA